MTQLNIVTGGIILCPLCSAASTRIRDVCPHCGGEIDLESVRIVSTPVRRSRRRVFELSLARLRSALSR